MALDATGRARTAAQFQRDIRGEWPAITKADLLAAVAAIDDWIDANQTSFNQALPQTFRSAADAAFKADLFVYVLMRRTGRLRAEED